MNLKKWLMNKKITQPKDFELETSTVQSFPRRGKWATHNSKYRGNRSPDVVRNLILRYSEEWDTLLDPMIWGWTTAIEAKLLNRNLIAYDINPEAIEITKKALDFEYENKSKITLDLNDARKFKWLKEDSIDFILAHPPYADIIKYSDKKIEKDLSNIHDIDKFVQEIWLVARESFRVLKPWKFCAILIWDTRRNKLYQPISFKVMNEFLESGFQLKEDIIKAQHNCKATGFRVKRSQELNFLLIMHEHLFVFQKI